jgi:hypothetical protein
MAGTQKSHEHQRVEVKTWCPDCGQELGHQTFDRGQGSTRGGLSQEELQAQEAAEMPDREAMSLVNANLAIPINLAAALNVLSDGSIAAAGAEQNTPITQGMMTPTAPTG